MRTFDITYGGEPVANLRARLAEAGVGLNPYAETLFASDLLTATPIRERATVLALCVSDLGFADGATLPELRERVRERGWAECPLDLAPWFRLQYLDQVEELETQKNKAPRGSITVLSPPLTDDEDFPKGFYLRRGNGQLWLRGYTCGLDVIWEANAVLAVRER